MEAELFLEYLKSIHFNKKCLLPDFYPTPPEYLTMLSKLQGYWYLLDSHVTFFHGKINIMLAGEQIQRALCGEVCQSVWKGWGVCNLYLQPHNVSHSIAPALFSLEHDTGKPQLSQIKGRDPYTHTPPGILGFCHSCAFAAVLSELSFTLTEKIPHCKWQTQHRTDHFLSRCFATFPHPVLAFLSENYAHLTGSFLQ